MHARRQPVFLPDARQISVLLVCSLAVLTGAAQTNTNSPTPASLMRELAPGVFQLGEVKIEKDSRRVTFPARLNMEQGFLEYLLVATSGKTHESLLVTDIQPQHLQVALLLLGAKGAAHPALTNSPSGGPITQASQAGNPPLPGEPIRIEVRWTRDGTLITRALEELAFNKRAQVPMSRGNFTFTGSRIWEGRFIAQTEGSLIAIVTDPDAVINNPRPGRDADDTWTVRPIDVPPLNTPVEVIVTLRP